jgi:hypothetical protein
VHIDSPEVRAHQDSYGNTGKNGHQDQVVEYKCGGSFEEFCYFSFGLHEYGLSFHVEAGVGAIYSDLHFGFFKLIQIIWQHTNIHKQKIATPVPQRLRFLI